MASLVFSEDAFLTGGEEEDSSQSSVFSLSVLVGNVSYVLCAVYGR